jgi:hypothetical protein
MDNLPESFGRLSTSAREWRPPQQQQRAQEGLIQKSGSSDWHQESSELSATAVKEFVPGLGWSAQSQTSNANVKLHSNKGVNSLQQEQWGGLMTSGE